MEKKKEIVAYKHQQMNRIILLVSGAQLGHGTTDQIIGKKPHVLHSKVFFIMHITLYYDREDDVIKPKINTKQNKPKQTKKKPHCTSLLYGKMVYEQDLLHLSVQSIT